MYKRSEGFFAGYDDTRLFCQAWASQDARAAVLITHGQGEHSECYARLIDGLSEAQFSFYAWDLRGHGRSEGRRGYVADFDEYCKDYLLFVERCSQLLKDFKGPKFILCHSMGGLIQLKSLIQHPHLQELFTAQVCSSPLTGLALPVPQWKQTGSKLMNQIYPQITLHNEIKNTDLTRDPEVIKDFEKDPLRHNRISPGAYLGFLSSFEYIHPHANEIKMPTLFQLPEADPVVSTPDNRRFFDQMSSRIKKLKLYPEAKHEMYNDIHRKQVYQDLKDFLVRMSEPQND